MRVSDEMMEAALVKLRELGWLGGCENLDACQVDLRKVLDAAVGLHADA